MSQQYIPLTQATGTMGVHWTTLLSWLKTNGIKYKTMREDGHSVHFVKAADFQKFFQRNMVQSEPKQA